MEKYLSYISKFTDMPKVFYANELDGACYCDGRRWHVIPGYSKRSMVIKYSTAKKAFTAQFIASLVLLLLVIFGAYQGWGLTSGILIFAFAVFGLQSAIRRILRITKTK